MPPTSRPHTPQEQRPAHLRALLPEGLSGQEAALRVARLGRRLGATGGAGGLTKGWEDARDDYAAFVQKQRIVSSDPALADALALEWASLAHKRTAEQSLKARDRETEITAEKYAEHLTFLLALARPATSETHAFAHSRLAQASVPAPTEREVWKSIFGDPPSPSADEGPEDAWEEPDWGSNASDIAWDDDLSLHGELSPVSSPPSSPRSVLSPRTAPSPAALDLSPVSAALPVPYRRAEPLLPAWADQSYYAGVRGWEGVSSVPSVGALLAAQGGAESDTSMPKQYFWKEADLVDEVLCALGGKETAAFQREETGLYSIGGPMELLHLDHKTARSLLEPLLATANDLSRLSRYTARTSTAALSSSPSTHPSLTEQAFAAAVDVLLADFLAHLGSLQAAVSRGDESPSLLSLGSRFERRVRALVVIDQLVAELPDGEGRGRAIVDALEALVDVLRQEGAIDAAEQVATVFLASAEPLWALVGRFLRHGISLSASSTDAASETDFFILPAASTSAPASNWAQTHTLVPERLPRLFEGLAVGVLGSGKAVGLLRALGVDWEWSEGGREWQTLATLLAPASSHDSTVVPFEHTLETYLRPLLMAPQEELRATLQDRCALRETLDGIESLFYLSDGVMGDWTEELFLRMDSGKPWTDQYTLKAALRDAAEAVPSSERRFDVESLGISIGRKHLGRRTARALSLTLEYSVPFPLSFVFHPSSLRTRSRVFTHLLQVGRVRHVLARLTVSQSLEALNVSQRKAFIGARLKLVWIVNVLWRYLATDVIHVQTQRLHALMSEAETLEDLIRLQDEHVSAVQTLSFLDPSTVTIHRTFMAIFDLALLLADLLACFLSSTLDNPHSAASSSSRPALPQRKKNDRSHRSRRRGRNDDGDDVSDLEPVGDGSEGEEGESSWLAGEGSRSAWAGQTTTISFVSEDLSSRLQRLTSDLRKHVHALSHGVDSLAKTTSTTPAADALRSTWATLSFALEQWKG